MYRDRDTEYWNSTGYRAGHFEPEVTGQTESCSRGGLSHSGGDDDSPLERHRARHNHDVLSSDSEAAARAGLQVGTRTLIAGSEG
eukprot:3843351-Rhodomonas_salina.1